MEINICIVVAAITQPTFPPLRLGHRFGERRRIPAMPSSWDIRIEGTDIRAEVVEKAQAGRYHRIEMNRGLPARFVVQYFDHAGENWMVKPELRRMCNFRLANLCSSPLPFNRSDDRFDVILLRNVMLYFSQETRKTLLAGIHKLLAPDGILFLGSSEQPADPSIWTPVLAGGTCYFRRKNPPENEGHLEVKVAGNEGARFISAELFPSNAWERKINLRISKLCPSSPRFLRGWRRPWREREREQKKKKNFFFFHTIKL